MQRRLLAAPALAFLGAAAAVFLPIQNTVVSQSGPGPKHTLELEWAFRSLLQTEGISILLAASLPVLIALAPMSLAGGRHAHRAESVSAALLVGFVIVAGFSIGLFYLPAAVAAIIVARRTSIPKPA